ncbi:polysaccharide deacetylase family protein [Spirillospora sp. CA-294931]|uniref:polysaccharide deacetylase family protein n=1 Tax=Spirillospora sp. CA-294931 TaxID=3240042 RepID=UPI003D93E94E
MPIHHKIAGVVVLCAVILGLTLPDVRERNTSGKEAARAGSSSRTTQPSSRAPADRPVNGQASPVPSSPGASATPSAPATIAAAPGAAAVKANELGEVPVLMYHRIMPKAELSLDRTVKEFREEATRLAQEGYVPITAAEFVSGRFNIPAGRHPVVLTFDDSTPGHFALDPSGKPKPDTAVAILMEVAQKHPGFRPVATFYLNKDMFGLGPQAPAGLRWLLQHGFELGNHTVTHPDLSSMSKEGVHKEIGGMESQILQQAGVHTTTLAYPFGSVPKKRAWALSKAGEWNFTGVFLAGWKPSESPFDTKFDPFAITRVRSEGKIKENDCKQFCSTAWLDTLAKNPATRYTSDGDPETISFPRTEEDRLGKAFRARGRMY